MNKNGSTSKAHMVESGNKNIKVASLEAYWIQ